MKLILVRHGDPNYKDNCLTPLGHVQAEAVVPRIAALEPDALYSSTYGRALETAEHTAAKLGMEITQLDFMREISTGPEGLSKEEKLRYSPWVFSREMAENGEDLLHFDFSDHYTWKGTPFEKSYARVTEGFDEWFAGLGYVREGMYYRCTRKNPDHVVIFAHGGSISCLLAHFTGIPVQFICGFININCTGITSVRFDGDEGSVVVPKILTINEHSHIRGLAVPEGIPQE